MNNLTFVAGYVRCAITRKACVTGSTDLGLVYIRATSQCDAGVLGVEANLERLKYTVAHCGPFLRACLGAIRRAVLEDIVANTKGKRKQGRQN